MCLLLLAFISSALALAASVNFRDVSGQFDTSLERMAKELRAGGLGVARVGTFPAGRYSIRSARMGNLTTIRRTSQASLVEVGGRLSVEGGVALEEMVIRGDEAVGNEERIIQPRVVVRENFWDYNFLVNDETEGCIDGVVVLSTDIGEVKLSSGDGVHDEEDVTYWVKHRMTDEVRRRITGAIADIFANHFDFCNLLKN